jgi:methylated-DNA-[protein]-cysteine S-methyltransferase
MIELCIDRIASAIGVILLVADGEQLCALDYVEYKDRMLTLLRRHYGAFQLCDTHDPHGLSSQLRAYLAGDFDCLNAISVDTGGTPFQQQVWTALRAIPAGTTCTYGAMATQLGRPQAARAVGMANGLNPIAIVVPCHRLVGANGALTGYAGGLERKQWLLQHEGVTVENLAV